MSLNDQIMDYATNQFGTTEQEQTTEEVAITASETTAQVETTDAAIAPVTTETTQEQTIAEPDYNKWLSETTGGLFADVDTFKSSLTKLTDYDTLATTKAELEKQKAELEEKVNQNPFATDFVAKLNEGIKSGWDTDRQQAFIKINAVDFDKLTTKEIKVANMVLNQGYSEDIAKRIVNKQFDLDEYEEGSDERLIKEEELRVSSQKDKQELETYKAAISKVENKDAEIAEQNRLQAIANETKYKAQLKEVSVKIAPQIKGIGELELREAGENQEAIKMNIDMDKDYTANMAEKVEAFLISTNSEINAETVEQAEKYIRADYLSQNFDKIAKSIFDQGYSLATEAMVNKYENRSGLPENVNNQTTENVTQEFNSFLDRVAGKR